MGGLSPHGNYIGEKIGYVEGYIGDWGTCDELLLVIIFLPVTKSITGYLVNKEIKLRIEDFKPNATFSAACEMLMSTMGIIFP
jgi:hypothetical protein